MRNNIKVTLFSQVESLHEFLHITYSSFNLSDSSRAYLHRETLILHI